MAYTLLIYCISLEPVHLYVYNEFFIAFIVLPTSTEILNFTILLFFLFLSKHCFHLSFFSIAISIQ